jgi:hypothetical protein
MPALVAGTHAFLDQRSRKKRRGWPGPGHDAMKWFNVSGMRLVHAGRVRVTIADTRKNVSALDAELREGAAADAAVK